MVSVTAAGESLATLVEEYGRGTFNRRESDRLIASLREQGRASGARLSMESIPRRTAAGCRGAAY